jgi:hypothetical protein
MAKLRALLWILLETVPYRSYILNQNENGALMPFEFSAQASSGNGIYPQIAKYNQWRDGFNYGPAR